ncbi:MAG: pyridoxal phosphate-dependent aminotransferase [Armatimonadetes bacterium]|nr:pyridoxal phosphate-dependent aminotransferase [Armatimonadota bacterium]
MSSHLDHIQSFKVMDILEAAKEIEASGEHVVHLEVGEPDFNTPPVVIEAAQRAIADGHTHYTHSLGILPLREAIAEHYLEHYGVSVSPAQIIVTTGTSAGLLLALSALCGPGEEMLLSDPHYACYPNFLGFLRIPYRLFPLEETEGFRYPIEEVGRLVGPSTRGLMVNSPANPTGMVLSAHELAALAECGTTIVSDEIYHGLVYGDAEDHTILEFTDEAFVLNGFSKRYAMTGWRLGWLIAPPRYVDTIQRVQQNLYISAPDFAQHAGTAALREAGADAEAMRQAYERRRALLVPGLRGIGLRITREPDGAFYVLADASHLSTDSLALSHRILREAKVGVTPGIDFGPRAEGCLRFAYANGEREIEEGLRRLGGFCEEAGCR